MICLHCSFFFPVILVKLQNLSGVGNEKSVIVLNFSLLGYFGKDKMINFGLNCITGPNIVANFR